MPPARKREPVVPARVKTAIAFPIEQKADLQAAAAHAGLACVAHRSHDAWVRMRSSMVRCPESRWRKTWLGVELSDRERQRWLPILSRCSGGFPQHPRQRLQAQPKSEGR
jgi:hypothetical protein